MNKKLEKSKFILMKLYKILSFKKKLAVNSEVIFLELLK